MDSIVQGLADVYDAITYVIARGAYWLSVVFFVLAALGAAAMLVDLLITPTRRFKNADHSAQPRDGIVLIGQLMAAVALAGGVVLAFRDTASAWQPAASLLGGAALLGLLLIYRRADEQKQAALARYVWLALAVSSVVAVILAYMQREDSSIPFLGLLLAVFVLARAWFSLARPEVHFDPSQVEVARESKTESPLVVEELGMVYELPDGGNVEALKDVTFTLEPGRLLTLLGPSGCGKTTLLNILAGFLAPTSGAAKLGSELITGPSQERGMVFQQGALFEWLTVNDNVGFGARMNGRSRPASREAVQDLLRIVGLQEFGEKAVYELSGGMQQRVALARCLANDPKIILMDEPLGALDALTREKMQSLVLNLWNETGKTIVLVTHSVEEALYLGDQLFVMAPRPGRIERVYDLPFAREALTADARELKTSPEFIRTREEILSMIWEMEEQIMGTAGGE
ncbi:MAG: ABC transporter ATP-binding protein [Acidimicrobiaceae bacterium]|nr:ABC transporter ATP-binding protein [Acidimicrobiaceae bacterium]